MYVIISPIQKILAAGVDEEFDFCPAGDWRFGAIFCLAAHSVSLWGELGGFGGLALLPDKFVWR